MTPETLTTGTSPVPWGRVFPWGCMGAGAPPPEGGVKAPPSEPSLALRAPGRSSGAPATGEFTELLVWIDPKRRQTCAFEQYVYECIHKRKMTRKQVALQEGLHEETVLGIFKKWAKQTVQQSKQRPVRVLGIDEIHLGHKEYALVLSDIERRRVIAVLPNRLKATLEQ